MEASNVLRQDAVFTMVFALAPEEVEEEFLSAVESSLVADTAATKTDLEADLAEVLSRRRFPWTAEIRAVEIQEGSIVIDVYLVLLGLGNVIGYYGQVRQGMNELTRDLQAVCHRFLGRLSGARVYPVQAGWMVLPLEAPAAPSAPASQKEILQSYLIASHAILLLALVGIVIVLLAGD